MRSKMSCALLVLVVVLFGQVAYASFVTTGPNGIDSSGLGLTGNGVGIGQIEISRPGDPWDNSLPGPPAFDTDAALFNSAIDPEGVFYTSVSFFGTPSFSATANVASETNANAGHATQVAGVMISTGVATVGVSTQAKLFSTGNVVGMLQDPFDIDSVSGQYIATRNSGNISAINMSFGYNAQPGELGDATSTISSFVDWSSRVHDVLYVVAGADPDSNSRVLIDNFNGITVASSKKDINGKYRIVGDDNIFHSNPLSPFTERTYTDLLAPGDDVTVAGQGNTSTIESGTSLAAPHVTGTVALLQEYANTQIGNGVAGWNPNGNARRHEVMKAVLMNSADKIEDDGTFVPIGKATPVPVGGLLGMSRTVLKKDGSDWDDSNAAYDPLLPLDEEMGAGHLNAARAVEQYSSGESDPDGATVPVIGWDYDSTTGIGDINKYVLNQELLLDSYISVTLAWDREVTFASDGGAPGVFDSGDTFNGYSEADADDVINDLNIFLMPKGATDPFNEAVWESSQDFMPLEHLLCSH